jgi:hypothetical protein
VFYLVYCRQTGKLEHLNLSHNPLKVIPTEVGNLELLAELGQWEIGIAFLNRLKHLDVSHCELMTWPTQVRCRFVCVAGVVYALWYSWWGGCTPSSASSLTYSVGASSANV